MRRRKASSTRSRGSRLVEKITNWSNGTCSFLPVGKREEVVPHFQGHDPAVQKLVRLDPLPAEIVDQQAAAVALHLQRRFVDVGARIVAQLEVVHGQFAADDHGGARDLQPAAVVFAALDDASLVVDHLLMIGGVVELDDLAVFVQGMGDPDFLPEAQA